MRRACALTGCADALSEAGGRRSGTGGEDDPVARRPAPDAFGGVRLYGPATTPRAGAGRARGPASGEERRLTPSALRALLGADPWAGRVRRHRLLGSAAVAGRRDAVIAIPARDESARIERCLDACDRSIAESALRVELLVLVNGSSDDTNDRVAAWSGRRARPVTLVDVEFLPDSAHAGAARALALELAALGAAANVALLTTDADTVVAVDWVRRNVAHLLAGVGLVCGAIGVDAEEAARLPPPVSDCAVVAGRYQRAMRELESRLDPDPWNRWPHHGTSGGASLALTRATLAAARGVPVVPCGEDRALAARVRGMGVRVRYADDVAVTVSCRLHGRAHEGMAATLRRRLLDPDPPCDAEFRTAARVRDDARLAAAVRRRWSERDGRERLLRSHGLAPEAAGRIAAVDDVADALGACRAAVPAPPLRISDLRAELPALLELIGRTHRPRERVAACRA